MDPLEIIVTLAMAIDANGHSVRVARYAAATAEELGLYPQEIESISYAGLLHDLGKVGVSKHILLKPAPLDVEEWEVVKTHPVIGAEILEPIPSLQEITLLVRHHHERYDGTGYPQGLTGEEIPLGARILAVADAFEAMTSYRPYRHAMSPAQAIAILKEGMGEQWDIEVVEAFIKTLGRERYPNWLGSVVRGRFNAFRALAARLELGGGRPLVTNQVEMSADKS